MRVCQCVREMRSADENEKSRTVETSKLRGKWGSHPPKLFRLTAAPQKYPAKFPARRYEDHNHDIRQTTSSVQQKSQPFSVIFRVYDPVVFGSAQPILAQLHGFASPSSPPCPPTTPDGVLVRPDES